MLQFKGLIFPTEKLCCLQKLIRKNLNSDQKLEARTSSKYFLFREIMGNKSLITAPIVDECMC